MKKLPLFLLFSVLYLSAFAGEIYVFHDSSCMDKLEFKEKTLTADYKLKMSGTLISYNIHANNNEIVRLDISNDGDELLSDMPIGTKNCNELIWDEKFAKDINAQVLDIYIVTLEGDKYRVSTVNRAEYFYASDDEIVFGNEAYGFSFDQGEFDTNADLLTYGLKSKVKFNFADDMHCPVEYHFYKSTKGRNLSENDITVVPQLGVIRNFTVSKKLNRNLREVELQKVNDMPLSIYMDQSCNNTTTAAEDVVSASPSEKMETSTEKVMIKETVAKEMMASTTATKKIITEVATPVTTQTCGHIWRNADTGFYYDRNTNLPAEGECGGITYVTGTMQNSDYQNTTLTTNLVSNAPIGDEFASKGGEVMQEVVATEAPVQDVIVQEEKAKIVYKEPKVIYKEAAPIVIDESIEPQDTKIISRPQITAKTTTYSNLDCAVTPRAGYHLVKKGETLYSLSNRYNVSIDELIKWNSLNNSDIGVCQHLRVQPEISLTQNAVRIPANEFVSKGGNASATIVTKAAPVKRVYHYIAQGETLYGICQKYSVDVNDVKALNKLNDNYLKPGWRLLIPNEGDQFDTPLVEQTAKPAIIKVITPQPEMTPKGGTSMKIPESSEEKLNSYQNQHIYHTVGESETINDIAMKYGTSINSLKMLNEMSEGEVLIPFQKIKVR